MNRHHVHLHVDVDTANAVGKRRGRPVLLKIRAAEMHARGHEFLVTPNNIRLVDRVPVEFIECSQELV